MFARKVIRLKYGGRIVISADADEALYQLRVVSKRISDMRPLLVELAGIMRDEARQRFAEGGRNPQWKVLAPSTIAAKSMEALPAMTPKGNVPRRLMQRGRFGPGNILIRSGALRDSWSRKNDPHHFEEIDVKRGTVVIGSDLPYAGVHQHGSTAYTILAKAGKALAFNDAKGNMIFRKKVNHPGLVARPVTLSNQGIQRMRDAAQSFMEGQLQTNGYE